MDIGCFWFKGLLCNADEISSGGYSSFSLVVIVVEVQTEF